MIRPGLRLFAQTLTVVAALSAVAAPVRGQTAPAATAKAKAPEEPMWLHPAARPLPFDHIGPFVETGDGGILCVKDTDALITRDGGKTWQSHPLFASAGKDLKVRPEAGLVRTRDGTIVLVLMDDNDKYWKWDTEKNAAAGKVWLHVWSIRSTDGGKTWGDLVKVQDGYSGAVRDVIETKNGNLIVPVTRYLPDHARHATAAYVSTDKGKTWKETALLDSGGRGHHDGSIESCVVELEDGRVWMLLRTSLDHFWQAFSLDQGMSWTDFGPTKIDASSSPGIVKRLASGRLMLAWNRLYPEGQTTVARRGGQASQHEASWHRDELAVAFSDDEGKTWSKPVVVARHKGKRVSYPYLFEVKPGVVWVTAMQGNPRIEINVSDLSGKEQAAK